MDLAIAPWMEQVANEKCVHSVYRLVTGPRDFEIHKFNNTILSGADLQMFTYYWKIEQMSAKLKENDSLLTSPTFSISGLNLRIRADFNHLNREFLFLQLEQVEAGANHGDDNADTKSSNLILKTGTLFKKVQTKVMFRHTITILNQVRLNYSGGNLSFIIDFRCCGIELPSHISF